MSPSLIVQALVLIVGGLAVYWSTISEIRTALAENRMTTRHHEKTIDELEHKLLELDGKLRDHDEITRKALPLGRKTELEPFTLDQRPRTN